VSTGPAQNTITIHFSIYSSKKRLIWVFPTRQLWISSTHPNAPAKIYPLPSSTSLIQQTLQTISPAYFGKTLSSYLGENPGLLGKAGEKFGAPVEAGKGERFLPFLMKVLTCKQGESESGAQASEGG
jgi:hypothetical protein